MPLTTFRGIFVFRLSYIFPTFTEIGPGDYGSPRARTSFAAPTLEKILVDILCDNALHALTGSEAYAIYSTAFDRYTVGRKTLLRYAGRRNRTEAVNTILKEIEK